MYKLIRFIAIPLFFLLFANAQAGTKSDTVTREKPVYPSPYHWNVIKFNPTPMLLFGEIRNITLTYERLITKDMSLSLQAGYLLFPRIFDDTVAKMISISGREKYGVNLCLDYRWYPLSRNRHPAPDGLYIGAYASYYGFTFHNNFDILYTTADQNGQLNGKLNVYNIGMSLGYQFIFWKRFSVDLLMFGPSFSVYNGNLDISGHLDPDQIQHLDQEMIDKLLQKYPMLKSIFSSEGLSFTGTRTSTSIGFRYSIQLGFHF
jgi:hypothetical protein